MSRSGHLLQRGRPCRSRNATCRVFPQPAHSSGILLVNSRHVARLLYLYRFAGQDLAAVVPPRPGRRIGYVVSMQPAAWPEPDPLVAAAIAAKYRGKRPRPLAVQIRDQLGQWLDDEEFASVFGIRGRPGWSPSLLALVTVLLATRCRTW